MTAFHLNCDLHTHTQFSDGKSGVVEMVFAAEALGLDAVAITDHYMGEDKSTWLEEMVNQVKECRKKFSIRILSGVEGTVLDLNGNTTVDENARNKVDITLAHLGGAGEIKGIGLEPPEDRKNLVNNIVRCLINVCENPLVDIVAHPFDFGRFAPQINLNEISSAQFREIAHAFVRGKKYFEIMNNMWWWYPDIPPQRFKSQYIKIIKIFRDERVKFSIGSDAHSIGGVGNLVWSNKVLSAAKVPKKQLIVPKTISRKVKLDSI